MSNSLIYDLLVGKNELVKSLVDSVKKAENLEEALTTAVGVFGGNLATKGFELVGDAIGFVIDGLNDSINAAAASETAINNLNAALGRAGNNTKQAREDLAAYAGELQRTTTFEDDAAFSALALLQSLTKLNSDGLQKGVSAAADLATVLGIDLESATRLVAKGAEGNVEAFKRYGVEIKKGANDTETFANLVDQLGRQFGGAAKSQLATYSGALTVLKNNYGDLQESVGGFITGNTSLIAFVNILSGEIANTSSGVATLQGSFNDATKTFINFGFAVATVGAEIAEVITGVLEPFVELILFIGGKITLALVAPIEKLIDGVIALGSVVPGLSDTFKDLENPISGASEAIDNFAEGAKASITSFDGSAFTGLKEGLVDAQKAYVEAEANVSIARQQAEIQNRKRVKVEEEVSAEILKQRQQLGLDLLALQSQLAIEEQKFNDDLYALNQENESAKKEAEIQAIYNQKIAEADAVYQGELLKNEATLKGKNLELANQKAYDNFRLSAEKATNSKIIAEKNKLITDEDKLNKTREANEKDTLATIATLAQNGNKTLGAIGKAASLAQIYISGSVAVAKALELGPIVGPPAAAAVAAAIAAQAANVVGVQFENGGVVGQGASVGADNRVATIRDGEMVLNANQQKNLFDMINGGAMGGEIVVQIDGREVARAVRNQINNGFRLA